MKTVASFAAIVGIAAAQASYGCPAPGTFGPDGRFSCNPATTYPEGQICDLQDGCFYLRAPGPGVSASGSAVPSSTTSDAPRATPDCPAPGTSGPDGRYSCNPARSYPEGQICDLQDGCYYLRAPGPGVNGTIPVYTTEVRTAITTFCPTPTTLTFGRKTTTISQATTITVTCPGGCTVTRPIHPTVSVDVPGSRTPVPSKPAGTPSVGVPPSAPSRPAEQPSVSVPTVPVYRTESKPAATPSVGVPPSAPSRPAAPPSPEQPRVSVPVEGPRGNGTQPAVPSRTQPVIYTGAANKLAGGAVGAAGVFAALFF